MNLFKCHNNPKSLHGFNELVESYRDKLITLAEKDDIPGISELLLDEDKEIFSKYFFETRQGQFPFEEGKRDYREILSVKHLNSYNQFWNEYLVYWNDMKPEFIKWLNSGFKRRHK